MSLGVTVKPEVNMAVKKAEVLMLQWSRMIGTQYPCLRSVIAARIHGRSKDAWYTLDTESNFTYPSLQRVAPAVRKTSKSPMSNLRYLPGVCAVRM